MEPKKVGRVLGVGVRVASNMVRQRMAQGPPADRPAAPVSKTPRAGVQMAAARRGARAFGQAILGPFGHAGGVLWLEITGLFFGLFAIFFLQNIYRIRASWRGGPDHGHLLLYCLLAFAFAWFSGSSFIRARRKSKRANPR